MTDPTQLTASAARDLMGEWRLALTSECKSPATITLYLDAVTRYLHWTQTHDLAPMRRITLQTWIAQMLEAGRSPATAYIRQQAVRRYAAWLTDVGHLDTTPFRGTRSPKLRAARGRPTQRRPGSCAAADLPSRRIG